MSAICGIFNFKGKPVQLETLKNMMTPMSYWGPDGSGTWIKNSVGLGHLMLYNTPEALHETLPFKDHNENYIITSNARIDNRNELFETLNIPHSEQKKMPDSILILKAYQKWGEDCPDHLLGDWVFAVWDKLKQKIFIARDHQGNTGLYYFRSDRFFVFSSCLKGLLALPEVPQQLNEIRIAQILACWPVHGDPTAYKDILRLPPAHAMRITADKFDVWQYWYLENTPILRLNSDQEYLEAFLEIYTEAVRCRLRSARPVGAMLSGGLDSGSVAALAAREMKKKGQRLPVFSSVPLYDLTNTPAGRFGDETPYIKATAQYSGNMDLNFIRAENTTPMQGIRRSLNLHDEPGHAMGNYFWIIALFEEARQQGIGTILEGQGGNATVSWAGFGYLAQLTRAGQWDTLWKEIMGQRKLHHRFLLRIIWGQIVRPNIPPAMIKKLYEFQSKKLPWENFSALNQNLVEQLNFKQLMFSNQHDPFYGGKTNTRAGRYATIKPGRAFTGSKKGEIGAGFGVDIRDATLDKRIIEFCLSIPDAQYMRNGENRFLIRRAMQGIMPSKVLFNHQKGLQAADLVPRIMKNFNEITSAFEEILQSEIAKQFFEIKKIKNIIGGLQSQKECAISYSECVNLTRWMGSGLFLTKF